MTEATVGPDDVAELTRRAEQLQQERDYLLVHSRNLEVELRRFALQPSRVRELEERLAATEARLRRVSFVSMARWLILEPDVAGRRLYRRIRDGAFWRLRERYRVFRLARRRTRA